MSYVSLFKNIPELLSQPTGIAAIASVGIHGAIALIVPLMPVNSNQQKDSSSQNTVGVVEINPADQSRLPQTPGSNPVALQAQLPLLQNQFPQQPQLQLQNPPSLDGGATTTLPPLPPPVAGPLSLPPITTIPENYRIASLPQSQPLRVSPRRNFQIDNSSGFNAAGNNFRPVTPPSFDDKQVVPATATPLPIDKLPELSAAKLPDNLPDNLPPTKGNSNPNPETTQPSENVAKLAPIGKTPTSADDLAFANQSIPKWQQGSTVNVPDLPSQPTEKTEITQVDSYARLRTALQQQYPNSQEKAVIRKTISTDKPSLEGMVLGVLVVDAEGKVVDIQFQDRSVSPELQLKTREYFTQNVPPADKQISRYPFSLLFQKGGVNSPEASQEKTPAVVLPKSGATPAENEAQPQPTPAATAKPLPELQINKNQPTSAPTPTPAATAKPVEPQQQVKKTQPTSAPTPTPAATAKPVEPQQQVKKTQPTSAPTPTPAATAKPVEPQQQVKKTQPTSAPTPTPAATAKPVEPQQQVKKTQPTSAPTPTPAATAKPVEPQQQVKKTQPTPAPTPTPAATVQPSAKPTSTTTLKPSSESTTDKKELSSSLESSQELIRKLQNLRETRQQQQSPNSEKN